MRHALDERSSISHPLTHELGEPDSPRELELVDYLAAIWRHRWLAVALTGICAVLGATLSFFSPTEYRATTLLSVSPPKADGAPLDARLITPELLVPILESPSLAAGLIHDLELGEPPLSLNTRRFLNRHLSVSTIAETSFVEAEVVMPTPALAQRVADALATRAVERARQMVREEAGTVEQQLQSVVAEAEARFQTAATALEEFRQSAQVELIRSDVQALLSQRGEFLKLQIQIDAERSRLARAEEELKQRPELDITHGTIADNAILLEGARELADGSSVLGLTVRNESVNEVYKEIDAEVASTRAKLAGLEMQRDQMIARGSTDAENLARLTDLYTRESTLERLQLEYDIAKKAFQDVAERFQGVKLLTNARTPQFQVVEPAPLPEIPQSRHFTRNIFVGAVFGLTLACLVAVGRLAVSRLNPRAGQPMSPGIPGA